MTIDAELAGLLSDLQQRGDRLVWSRPAEADRYADLLGAVVALTERLAEAYRKVQAQNAELTETRAALHASTGTRAASPDEVARRRDRLTLAEGFVTVAGGIPAVDVADTVQGLVEQCLRVLPASAATLLLVAAQTTGGQEGFRVAAATSDRLAAIDTANSRQTDGPCADALRDREVVVFRSHAEAQVRWAGWAALSGAVGVQSGLAVPLWVGETPVGVLNVFADHPDAFDSEDVAVARALAQVAAAVLVSRRETGQARLLAQQLQYALDSRVVIEQAKGVVATAAHLTMEEAFNLIRATARSTNTRLADLAARIADGELTTDQLARAVRPRR